MLSRYRKEKYQRGLMRFLFIDTNRSLFLFSSVRLQLQATAVGEVVIKGISANRYLAMSAEGRLFGTVSPQRAG